jgi:glycosyltransferase involved in cell wall biosynthesis
MTERDGMDKKMNEPIKLASPAEAGPKQISLHLMVKNGESVVGRLLDCVGPYITGVVAVLNDCTDRTADVLADKSSQYSLLPPVLITVTSETHPDLYIRDVAETYAVGKPLVGEVYEGPFTGRQILADWAGARNLGWQVCSGRWKLFCDADDVISDPQSLPGLCRLLDERGLVAAASRYHYEVGLGGASRVDTFRERLARDLPGIRWSGCVHEHLTGFDARHVAQVDGTLVVRDMRDSEGTGIRIPGRNLKVLYHSARERDWQITTREMIYLAAESRAVMPRLAVKLIELYLPASRWPEEKSWAASMMGEICENDEDYASASLWYEWSHDFYPGVLPNMRLARARFHQGLWAEAVAAYERGIALRGKIQLLDGGEAYEGATQVLVVACLRKLGRVAEAARMCEEASSKYPHMAALREMREVLARDESRTRNSVTPGGRS